jgi:hypothetical protein
MNNTFSRVLFRPEQESEPPLLFKNSFPIGMMRFRQQRTQIRACSLDMIPKAAKNSTAPLTTLNYTSYTSNATKEEGVDPTSTLSLTLEQV